jgi:hypothetical protein
VCPDRLGAAYTSSASIAAAKRTHVRVILDPVGAGLEDMEAGVALEMKEALGEEWKTPLDTTPPEPASTPTPVSYRCGLLPV